ncbi:MAG: hypothetical protein ACFCVD_16605 [Nodosilinea sp.]
MKFQTLLTSTAVMGLMATGLVSLSASPQLGLHPAGAEEMSDATGLSGEQKVAFIEEHKGQFGGGDQLRRFFFGDLEPISVQPGGAGMVVNLYNKATDTTFAYCATYDVVVAVGAGRVMEFPADQVQ